MGKTSRSNIIMFAYILFVFIILILYWHRKPVLMLLTMLFFAAIRYDVGWDYGSYYEFCSNENMLEYVKEKYSIIWSSFFSLMYLMKTPHLGVVIPNILSYILVYLAAVRIFGNNKKAVSFVLLVYVLWPDFYLTSFSTIRQHLAISVALYSGALFMSGMMLPGLALATLNYFIHPSSIIVSIILLILMLKKRLTIVHVLAMSILVLMMLFMLDDLISFINLSQIQEYKDIYFGWTENYGSKYKYLLALVLIILFIIFFNIKSDRVLLSKIATITILGIVINLFIYSSGANSVLGRVATYFTVYLTIALYPMLSELRNGIIWRKVAIMFLICLFFIQLYLVQGVVQLHSTSSYIPFRTIFEIFR